MVDSRAQRSKACSEARGDAAPEEQREHRRRDERRPARRPPLLTAGAFTSAGADTPSERAPQPKSSTPDRSGVRPAYRFRRFSARLKGVKSSRSSHDGVVMLRPFLPRPILHTLTTAQSDAAAEHSKKKTPAFSRARLMHPAAKLCLLQTWSAVIPTASSGVVQANLTRFRQLGLQKWNGNGLRQCATRAWEAVVVRRSSSGPVCCVR